jgi:hypothetical protein
MPEEKDQKPEEKEEVLTYEPAQFSKKFQSILYSEPKHLARIGFYLVFATVIILGGWSFFTIVNKSYILKGEVTHLNPDFSIGVPAAFEFKRHSTYIGQEVKRGDVLFEYLDVNKNSQVFTSPISGNVSQKIELKQGIVYPAATEVLVIRPEGKEVTVRLYVPDNILNRIKINNNVLYHFSFSFSSKNVPIEGTVLTEPALDKDRYIVESKIDDKSLKFLEEQKIKLISGMVVTAEIIVGKERLLGRFLGVEL